MDKYETLKEVGEGAYGTVYKAKNQETGEIVALKEIQLTKDEGIPGSLLREISILKELKHENIVKLNEVIQNETKMVLVFEYIKQDLRKYFRTCGFQIEPAVTRSIMLQLLKGLEFCHSKEILHRDLKPSNLLINKNGDLKIADFGMARCTGVPVQTFTSTVVSLWYRPPDVLFGATKYTTTVDIWSAGCIFAEISNVGTPLFPVVDEDDQLSHIFRVLGTPAINSWPGVQNLPKYKLFPTYQFNPSWSSLAPNLCKVGHDLLSKLVVCNPDKRITADVALEHPYFINTL